MSEDATLYHVAIAADWRAAQESGVYFGSVLCRAHGFIHLSKANQLGPTLARFFAGRSDLVLLAVAAADIAHALKWEAAPDGELFPHYYGALAIGLVREVGPITLDQNGRHRLPALEAAP